MIKQRSLLTPWVFAHGAKERYTRVDPGKEPANHTTRSRTSAPSATIPPPCHRDVSYFCDEKVFKAAKALEFAADWKNKKPLKLGCSQTIIWAQKLSFVITSDVELQVLGSDINSSKF